MSDFNNSNIVLDNKNTHEGIIEKILHYGAEYISETELLILLLSERGSNSSVELVRQLMGKYRRSAFNLCEAEKEELLGVEGMNTEVLAKILAMRALSTHIGTSSFARELNMSNSHAIRELLSPKLKFIKHLEYYAVFMNRKYELIKYVKISQGGYTEATIDKRLILREALLCNASAITIVHNQPGGITEPSTDEVEQTLALKQACDVTGIRLFDHVIIEDGFNIYSYLDKGKLQG